MCSYCKDDDDEYSIGNRLVVYLNSDEINLFDRMVARNGIMSARYQLLILVVLKLDLYYRLYDCDSNKIYLLA